MRMARDEPELERNAVRYTTKPLPPYRYLPGLHPHPMANPHGHSHGAPDEPHPAWDPEEWRALDDWLYGVDLCNHHYYWESHEAWEARLGVRLSRPAKRRRRDCAGNARRLSRCRNPPSAPAARRRR